MTKMTWGENCPFCPPTEQCAHQLLLDQMETWDWDALLSEGVPAGRRNGGEETMSEERRAELSAQLDGIEATLLERPDLWR